MYSLAIIVVLLFPCNIYSASVLQRYVYVRESGSFLQYMTDVGDNLATCSAVFTEDDEDEESIVFELDPKSTTVVKPEGFEDEYNLFERMSSLGQNLCGFKLTNSSTNDPVEWTLMVTDAFDNHNEASFDVLQYDYEHEELYTSMNVIPGLNYRIACGTTDGTIGKDFCKIFHPNGHLVTSTACSYSLIVTIADLGKWRCLASMVYTMEPIEFIIELITNEPASISGWVTEDDNHYRLGCQMVNNANPPSVSYCVITNPSGDDFVIRPGRATDRYTTLATDFTNRICGMEIPKPVRDNEFGLWKCKIGNWGYNLYLSNGGMEEPIPNYERNFTLAANLGATGVVIACEVPYSATYCHITAPNGTRYYPSSLNVNLIRIGQCSYAIGVVLDEHIGTWICSYARDGEYMFDNIEVELKITDLLIYDPELQVDQGDDVELVCRTGGEPGVPIGRCLYNSPSNVSYYIHEALNASEIVYIGRGFDYGDCSIRLNSIPSEHFGNWTCVIFYVDGVNLLSRTILLTETPITLSGPVTEILIAVGAVAALILIVIIIILIYKFKKRRQYEGSPNETVIFSRNTPQRGSQRGSQQVITTINVPSYTSEVRQQSRSDENL